MVRPWFSPVYKVTDLRDLPSCGCLWTATRCVPTHKKQ